jgi:hypothetical protein
MTGFFEEAPGERSMMRLLSFVCVLVGCLESILGCYALIMGKDGMSILTFSSSLIIAGFTGKIVQRVQEKQDDVKKEAQVSPKTNP